MLNDTEEADQFQAKAVNLNSLANSKMSEIWHWLQVPQRILHFQLHVLRRQMMSEASHRHKIEEKENGKRIRFQNVFSESYLLLSEIMEGSKKSKRRRSQNQSRPLVLLLNF